jgi:hypothetical protein
VVPFFAHIPRFIFRGFVQRGGEFSRYFLAALLVVLSPRLHFGAALVAKSFDLFG